MTEDRFLVGERSSGPVEVVENVHGKALTREKTGRLGHADMSATGPIQADDRGIPLAIAVRHKAVEADGLSATIEGRLGLGDGEHKKKQLAFGPSEYLLVGGSKKTSWLNAKC